MPLDAKIEAKLAEEFPVEKNDKLNSNYLYFSVRDLLEFFQYTDDSEWREDIIFLRSLNNINDYSDDPKIIAKLSELEKFYEQNNYFVTYWEWWSDARKNDYLAAKFTQDQLLSEASKRKTINDRYVVISSPVLEGSAVFLTFTILDLKNKTVKAQIKIPSDPKKFEDFKDCTPEQINTYILNQVVAQIKNDKNIENLNNVAVLASDCKISVDQKKYDLLAEGESKSLEQGATLIQKMDMGGCVLSVCVLSGGTYYNFNLELNADRLNKPIKIDGKLFRLKFFLPKGHGVEINSRPQPFYDFPGQSNIRKFEFGQDENIGGSLDAVSQDQIVELVIKDEKGEMAGKLLFEQMPAFYMGDILIKKSETNKEAYNLNFYITDLDTLQTFQSIGREQYTEALKETAYGVTQLEKYFQQNWNISNIYVGGDVDVDNAYFAGFKNERSIFLTARSLVVEGAARRGKDIYRSVGRHEALHKFDWSLGPNTTNPDNHYYSEQGAFALLFEQVVQDLEKLTKKVQENATLSDEEKDKIIKGHFIFLISEDRFFDDPAACGHPLSAEREFFVSLINSLFEEPAKWEAKVKSWSPENQHKYLKSLVIVEKVLRKKGVDTSNLQKDIAKLRKIINK